MRAVFLLGGGTLLALFFIKVPATVTAPTTVAVLTAGVSVYSIIWSRRSDRDAQIAEAQRPRKVEVYEEFVRFWFNTLLSSKTGQKPPDERSQIRFFADFTQKLIAWGSDEVIREFSNFRQLGGQTNPDGVAMMTQFERLLLAIRKDLGHENLGIESGDLLRLFVTDWDSHRPSS